MTCSDQTYTFLDWLMSVRRISHVVPCIYFSISKGKLVLSSSQLNLVGFWWKCSEHGNRSVNAKSYYFCTQCLCVLGKISVIFLIISEILIISFLCPFSFWYTPICLAHQGSSATEHAGFCSWLLQKEPRCQHSRPSALHSTLWVSRSLLQLLWLQAPTAASSL